MRMKEMITKLWNVLTINPFTPKRAYTRAPKCGVHFGPQKAQ